MIDSLSVKPQGSAAMWRSFLILISVPLLGELSVARSGPAPRRHVVVVVWDGMRPDFVTEQNCPTLYQLAKRGVFFAHHHSTYPSATEVNGTAISTGSYPAHSGLVGNAEYRPELDWEKGTHTESLDAVRKGDELTHDHYLQRQTIAEIVRHAGRRTMVAGAKAIALLPDRFPRSQWEQGANVYYGNSLPEKLIESLTNRFGPFPADGLSNMTRTTWTTRVMVESLWSEGVPDFTFLWMNEPDASQHRAGPGSDQALKAIRNSDDNLERVLKALEAKGVLDQTDIMVVSDHGCSTVAARADLAGDLVKAGVKATRALKSKPKKGEVLVVSNSGSSFIYVVGYPAPGTRSAKSGDSESDTGNRATTIKRIVTFLQSWESTGVILTRDGLPGTFPLSKLHLDSQNAPDIVVSLRWTAATSKNGTPGTVQIDGNSFAPGQGAHVSLSPYDMHATLIAAGPDFRSGIVNTLASGNVDIAPTVLWLMGIKPPSGLDGRVLSEALTVKGPGIKSFNPFRAQTGNQTEGGRWHQYLNLTEVNGVTYCDEGNGSAE
jgi:predicted AlkP superfamily pyrophosphatase or phosphodiesterase